MDDTGLDYNADADCDNENHGGGQSPILYISSLNIKYHYPERMLSNLNVSKNMLTPEAVSVILSIIPLFFINTPIKSKSVSWDAILLWSKRKPGPFLTSDTWLWQSNARLRHKIKWRNIESVAKYNKYANISFQKPYSRPSNNVSIFFHVIILPAAVGGGCFCGSAFLPSHLFTFTIWLPRELCGK